MYRIENPSSINPLRAIDGLPEKFGYFGLCAFVAAFAAARDATAVGGFVVANWIALIPLGFVLLRVFATGKFRRFSAIHFLLLAFTIWASVSLLWTLSTEYTITRIGTYVQLLILVVLIWELAPTKTRVQGLVASYVIGAGYASVITIHNYISGKATAAEQQLGYRYTVEHVNADELALMVGLSVPMALYLVNAINNRWARIIGWAQVVVGFTAVALTATRGGMFALLVGVLLMAVPTFRKMSFIQKGLAVGACFLLISFTLYFVPPASIDRLLSSGTELTQGTLTHRTVIWAAGLQVFRNHPFFGVGAGAYGPAVVSIIDIPYIGHNTFISILVELGVVGAFIMALLLVSMFFSALRMEYGERWFWLALLSAWMVGASSVTWENRKTTWVIFGLLAAQAYAKTRGTYAAREPLPQFTYNVPPPSYLRPAPMPVTFRRRSRLPAH